MQKSNKNALWTSHWKVTKLQISEWFW